VPSFGLTTYFIRIAKLVERVQQINAFLRNFMDDRATLGLDLVLVRPNLKRCAAVLDKFLEPSTGTVVPVSWRCCGNPRNYHDTFEAGQ
jgi:hypothetical protein